MKSKHYILKILSTLSVIFIFFLTGCGGRGSVERIEMNNKDVIEIKSGDFSYDGIKVLVIYSSGQVNEINLTENMIPDEEKLYFYKMGEHDVKVQYGKYSTTMKINVVSHEFDDIYRLDGYTCVYDGLPHKVEINYELPEGATVDYPYGNTFTNAGNYEVVAVISKDGYESKILKTNLVIEEATLDLSNVVFEDKVYEYDGEPKSIEATNIPQGVTVQYEIWNDDETIKLNNAVNAGTYTIVSKYIAKDENYDQTSTKKAKLTITKSTYDMSNVKLSDVTKEYNGQEYIASFDKNSSLPTGVESEFKYYNLKGEEVSSTINAGEYKIIATFKGNNPNYEEIAPLEAKLVVTKKIVVLDGVITFNSKTINFDRANHSLEISGKLPNNVTVSYENNDQIVAGEYKVLAKFSDSNPNEQLDINELEAYLIINKIKETPQVIDESTGEKRTIEPRDFKLCLDQETGNKKINISGFIEDEYRIKKIQYLDFNTKQEIKNVSDFCDGKRYDYNIVFEFINPVEKDSINLSPASGTISFDITFEDDIKLIDAEYVYDGNLHGLAVNKELPVGTNVNYPEGEEFTDVGIYTIVWELSKDTYRTKQIIGTLKITKATYDMSKVVIENVTKEYDGNNYFDDTNPESLVDVYEPFANLPEGVAIKSVVTKNKVGEDWMDSSYTANVGEYKFNVEFTYDELNYNPLSGVEFYLTIEKKFVDLSNYKLNDMTVSYTSAELQDMINNGRKIENKIEPETLPDGITITYEYKRISDGVSLGDSGVSEFGRFDVIVTIYADSNLEIETNTLTATLVVDEIF